MTQVAGKRPEAKQVELLTATVVRRERISPSFARLTLAGERLAHLPQHGYDHWFRMFIPSGAHQELPLPNGTPEPDWYARFLAAPAACRPAMRYVTVREHRRTPHHAEIDVDVVVHGEPGRPDTGPLSTWAQTAEQGETVGIIDQGLIFRPEMATEHVLLVGDETAVPALAGILRSLPHTAGGNAVIEVPTREDVQELSGPPGIEVTWLDRDGVSELLLAAARRVAAAGRRHHYLYAAGESAMTTALNQAMQRELGWPKERLHTVGYWHLDRAKAP